ncbi:hypothetical protein GGR56DRAFT_291686 [Xylariaceae sp. FL0804]|nr:hypothetical protein GGR56DRAFT_291686 [Xylariaceae sp. FL0804]
MPIQYVTMDLPSYLSRLWLRRHYPIIHTIREPETCYRANNVSHPAKKHEGSQSLIWRATACSLSTVAAVASFVLFRTFTTEHALVRPLAILGLTLGTCTGLTQSA